MDLALLVYGISLLQPIDDALSFVNICIALLVCLGLFAGLISAVDYDGDFWKWFKSKLVWLVVAFCVVGTIKVFIPKEKTAYIMVGAYATQAIAQNPNVEKVGSKVLTILNQKLDQYVEEGIDQAEKAAEKKLSKKEKKDSK